jgi:hypothetical protein
MWHRSTRELYSAIKKNEIVSSPGKWRELESIMLSEISQAQKSNIKGGFLLYVESRLSLRGHKSRR